MTKPGSPDTKDTPSDRALVLTWLSALFASRPTADFVASHRRGPAGALLRRLGRDADCTTGIATMIACLDAAVDDATLADDLGRQFGLAFEGIGGPRTAPPFESVYRQGAPWRLFQEPASEMSELLARHDLSFVSGLAVSSDHLAVELALAAHLLADGDAAFPAMIERLALWVPAFAARCAEVDRTGFWRGAARVLATVVARERSAHAITPSHERAA